MPSSHHNFQDLIQSIRASNSTPERKLEAAATIAMQLLQSQAIGGAIGNANDSFDPAATGTSSCQYSILTKNILTAISTL